MILSLGVVLPGDVIKEINLTTNSKIVLGPGLRQEDDKVLASKAGVLYKKEPKTFWIDNHQKRYVPARGEDVVGVVLQKVGDYFKVDIGSSEPATISYLAFENATKKNRPNIKPGDALFAKLLVANKEMEPEIVCVDSHGKAGKLGVLEDGFLFTTSLHHIRKILSKDCNLLELLKKEMPFEVAIGLNGKIWIRANTSRETIAIGNAILGAEYVSNDELKQMCRNIASLIAKFS